MKVFVAPKRDEMGKFLGVVQAFPNIWEGTVLDVGCRSGSLKSALLNQNAHYVGLDLNLPAHVIGDLEAGLPFGNESIDTIVALDVLEHTDNIYLAFHELCRVARQHVVISLPNNYEIKVRFKFLIGRSISGKYGLPSEPAPDRHRWLFSFEEARNFCTYRAQLHGFQILAEGCLIGPKRSLAMGKFLVPLFPNIFSPNYIVLIRKKEKTKQ